MNEVVVPTTYPVDCIEIKFVLTKEMIDYHSDYGREELEEPKCECGGDVCHTTHSSWCPKYKEK